MVDMKVEEHFRSEYGSNSAEVIKTWLGVRLDPGLPDSYKRLCREVVFRLPWGWDTDAEWAVTVDWDQNTRGYISVLREEKPAGGLATNYMIAVYPTLMDRLSDCACRWVFAHEFAYIRSGFRCGSIVIRGKPYTRVSGSTNRYEEGPPKNVQEDAADRIAMDWGFTSELTAFLAEYGS